MSHNQRVTNLLKLFNTYSEKLTTFPDLTKYPASKHAMVLNAQHEAHAPYSLTGGKLFLQSIEDGKVEMFCKNR